MSRENLERLRNSYDTFSRTGEIDTSYLAPDFKLRQASSIIDTAGVFRGPGALRDSLRELADAFDDFTLEAEQFIEAPDGRIVILVHARGRGRGSGIEMDNRIAFVVTFRDEMAIQQDIYEERAEAFEAVGLSDSGTSNA